MADNSKDEEQKMIDAFEKLMDISIEVAGCSMADSIIERVEMGMGFTGDLYDRKVKYYSAMIGRLQKHLNSLQGIEVKNE